MRPDRSGFTLLEIIVALAIGGLVIAGVRSLLDVLGTHAARMASSTARIDADANTERLVRAALGQLSVRADTMPAFHGDGTEAAWRSWCDTVAGFREPCFIRLLVTQGSTGAQVTLAMPASGDVSVRTGLRNAGLRYLADAADGGHWREAWPSSLIPPIAIGIVMDDDTLVARIGERR